MEVSTSEKWELTQLNHERCSIYVYDRSDLRKNHWISDLIDAPEKNYSAHSMSLANLCFYILTRPAKFDLFATAKMFPAGALRIFRRMYEIYRSVSEKIDDLSAHTSWY